MPENFKPLSLLVTHPPYHPTKAGSSLGSISDHPMKDTGLSEMESCWIPSTDTCAPEGRRQVLLKAHISCFSAWKERGMAPDTRPGLEFPPQDSAELESLLTPLILFA